MSARSRLLLAATTTGWVALGVALLVARSNPFVALPVAAASLLVWNRRGVGASVVAPLGCAWLLAPGTSGGAAAAVGLLAVGHLVLVDLAADAHGAPVVGAVVDSLRRLLPGLALAAAAAVVVLAAAAAGSMSAGGWLGSGLLLGAPLLLLSAVLAALGIATRRSFWAWLGKPSGLSGVTKRYLARASSRRV
jgi:hypothetical protein